MLSPETWTFPPPRVSRSVLIQAEQKDVAAAARAHPYYHTVTVVCPDEYKLPDSLLDAVRADNDFYKLKSCPAVELISKEFVEWFVRKGSVSCLSINRHSDIDNCIAITQNGKLVLHIVDKLYEEVGLDGICIDLKSERLNSEKYYKKLKNGLQKLGCFDLILKWVPHAQEICPSSLAKYFADRNLKVSSRAPQVTCVRRTLERVPCLGEHNLEELVEWVGLVVAGGDLTPLEPYVSTYAQPVQDEDISTAHAAVLMAKGFFSADDIVNIHAEICKYNSGRDDSHWTALSFHSFTDSPCTCQSNIQFKATDVTWTIFCHNLGNSIHKTVAIK